jgi:hypothetical protein
MTTIRIRATFTLLGLLLALQPALSVAAQPTNAANGTGGLADLRAALARAAAGSGVVRGVLSVETQSRDGSDEERGSASVAIDDGPGGVRTTLPRELLQRAEAEERLREKDPAARTPVLNALKALELRELRALVAPASALAALLEQAIPRGEAAEAWAGQPARKLSFELPLSRLKERERKYVRQFDSRLDVWIGADGLPLAHRIQTSVSGRAFVVVGFESSSSEETHYQRAGDRLVVQRRERKSAGSGGGEKGDTRSLHVLQLNPG